MSNIIILPTIKFERREPRADPESLVARISIGPRSHIRVHAFTANEMCVPLVELHGTMGDIDNLTVDQAEALGQALIKAAAMARGGA